MYGLLKGGIMDLHVLLSTLQRTHWVHSTLSPSGELEQVIYNAATDGE